MKRLLTISSMGGGGRSLFFCPFLKISLGTPYLKIFDITKLFNADTPMKKHQHIQFYPLSEHLEVWV